MSILTYVIYAFTPGNHKKFRAICTGSRFLQFFRALGESGTVVSEVTCSLAEKLNEPSDAGRER